MDAVGPAGRPRQISHKRNSPSRKLGPRELRRLIQLGASLAIFFLLFFGNGIFPERIQALRGDVLEAINCNTNFKQAFQQLGRSISDGKPAGETLSRLWVTVFGTGAEVYTQMPGELREFHQQRKLLDQPVTAASILDRLQIEPAITATPVQVPIQIEPQVSAPPEPSVEPVPTPTPRVYSGPDLPQNTSMDYVALELGETTTPVIGVLTSDFGYRDHPIDGEYKFHYGTDLAANKGTSIVAFANGTVDFVGESPAYGLYIQLDHGGGVTSFYAHCSALCATQGEAIAMGQKIAEVGDTGNVTGSHLHLEIKRDGVYCDPAYYVDIQ